MQRAGAAGYSPALIDPWLASWTLAGFQPRLYSAQDPGCIQPKTQAVFSPRPRLYSAQDPGCIQPKTMRATLM